MPAHHDGEFGASGCVFARIALEKPGLVSASRIRPRASSGLWSKETEWSKYITN